MSNYVENFGGIEMKQVKIITDSCSDLTPDLMAKYDIDYAQMNTVLDGKTSPASLAWTDGEVHEFYEIMRSGKLCRVGNLFVRGIRQTIAYVVIHRAAEHIHILLHHADIVTQ